MVAVIGAGVMGLAAARELARAGREVTVYEQFRVGHRHGSSHGSSRIFRLSYPEPEWVALAQEALAGWRELEAESGETLLELNGLLELVRGPEEGSRAALDTCGVPWELLGADEVERRFGILVPEGQEAVFQADAGIVRADRALRAFGRGLRVEEETKVGLDVSGETVVVTAGAWAKELLGLPVKVTRETVVYFRLDGPVPSVADFKAGGGHGYYSLADPVHGLKVGAHHVGAEVDPDAEGEPDPAIVADIVAWTAARFPHADPEPAALDTCLYTTTVDESFILERRGRVVVGSACSGHGFKFAPAIGARLAALA